MAFRFRGVTIPGTILRHGKPPYALQTYRTHFFRVNGVSEILGGRGGRPLEFPILLHNRWPSRQALETYIDNTLQLVLFGRNGEIDYRDGDRVVPPYKNCTFHGFEMEGTGPLLDVAGTLDGGWFCYGRLLFFQLL